MFVNTAENATPMSMKLSVIPESSLLPSRPESLVTVMPASRTTSVMALFLHFRRGNPVGSPTAAPMTTGRKIITGIIYSAAAPPETTLAIRELTVKKTAIPTTSSSTAIGKSVSVTGPFE